MEAHHPRMNMMTPDMSHQRKAQSFVGFPSMAGGRKLVALDGDGLGYLVQYLPNYASVH